MSRPTMTAEDIELAIVRVEGALANEGMIDCIIAEGWGQSNRDVPLKLSAEDSMHVFRALRDVLWSKEKL